MEAAATQKVGKSSSRVCGQRPTNAAAMEVAATQKVGKSSSRGMEPPAVIGQSVVSALQTRRPWRQLPRKRWANPQVEHDSMSLFAELTLCIQQMCMGHRTQ
eukprot:798143-Pelagomonas_calceolata.AAC.1